MKTRLRDFQTDGTIGVDVWVVDSGGEGHLGRFEWIVSWKMNVQEEYTALNSNSILKNDLFINIYLIRRIWWTHDGCLPVKEIIANRPSRALKEYNRNVT